MKKNQFPTWFKTAVGEAESNNRVDFFLLCGHLVLRNVDVNLVEKTRREVGLRVEVDLEVNLELLNGSAARLEKVDFECVGVGLFDRELSLT